MLYLILFGPEDLCAESATWQSWFCSFGSRFMVNITAVNTGWINSHTLVKKNTCAVVSLFLPGVLGDTSGQICPGSEPLSRSSSR